MACGSAAIGNGTFGCPVDRHNPDLAIVIDGSVASRSDVCQNRRNRREMRHPSGDLALQPRRGRGDMDRAGQDIADTNRQMRPPRPGFAPQRENAGCPLRREAAPFQRAHGFAGDALGQSRLRRHDRDIDLPSARSSSDGSRGAAHSTATPGASDRSRASRSANMVCMKSGAATRKTRRELAGSKICRGDSTRCMPRSIGRACSSRSSAKVVGCIRTPALISKGSLSCRRSPRQRVADGRLRPPQPFCRAGHVALDHQNFEHHQQVEVEPA